mgnify:CR=1 FL=1
MQTPPSTLSDWLNILETRHAKSIDMGLDRVLQVKDKLGIQFHCPVIMVAGTNGKGSTCAMLESILLQAGYRVGLYIKPHFLHFNERARVGGEPVSDTVLFENFNMVESQRGAVSLTYFEFTTLAIMRLLAEANLDVVILEVGLGGRIDSTNVISPILSVITNIGWDHMDLLGDTLEAIAREKAGIIKHRTPVAIGPMLDEPLAEILAIAQEKQAKIYRDWPVDIGFAKAIPLHGDYQKENLQTFTCALEALKDLWIPIKRSKVLDGLKNIFGSRLIFFPPK